MHLEQIFGIFTKPYKHGIHANVTQTSGSRYSVYATGCTIRGSNPDGGKRFFTSPNLPDWLWGPASLLLNEYTVPFPEERRPGREDGPFTITPCEG